MDTGLAVPFFVVALVPTGLLSFFFVRLLRDVVVPRFARALVGNSMSLLVLTMVGSFVLSSDGTPNVDLAFMAFLMPQGIWTLFAALPLNGRSAA